ncbi:alpha/beta-hydrolase [Stereum hirsutum FP-91666 SS1]|uniref:alpha/beta-hydrolase n=1 Tax=Stereum hirsutum (strain FP-91666) TaxID=721885 RepID=UPI000444A69F|nr:alpha/beta-hydrolase [Stereum hirsutum FP-91666 SS1]EIM81619.1 alpha/beta-hydrolase [Stereum hirsutum FP-91666 SS1]
MFFRSSSSSLVALLITAVSTAALPPRTRNGATDIARVDISSRSVTTLTSSQLSAFTPFTQFARAAYCDPSVITGWTCGEACTALPGFEPTLTGGDGDAVQFYFVGYWPSESTVVVAHQGTDPTQFESDLTDVNFSLDTLDSTLFPGVSSDVEVHNGFAAEHAKTAATILTEVKSLMSEHSATKVTLVGHSLGGALAELDALFLSLNLPTGTTIKGVTYGTPRVGNPAFVTFFDSKVSDFTRVNNELDLIPTLPGRFLGFEHPATEVHIVSAGDAVSCAGDDDGTDSQCTDLQVPNIFVGNIIDHLGPYEGIYIGTIFCT